MFVVLRDPFVRLYSLSYLWYSATAMLYVVSVGLIVSFATGKLSYSPAGRAWYNLIVPAAPIA